MLKTYCWKASPANSLISKRKGRGILGEDYLIGRLPVTVERGEDGASPNVTFEGGHLRKVEKSKWVREEEKVSRGTKLTAKEDKKRRNSE